MNIVNKYRLKEDLDCYPFSLYLGCSSSLLSVGVQYNCPVVFVQYDEDDRTKQEYTFRLIANGDLFMSVGYKYLGTISLIKVGDPYDFHVYWKAGRIDGVKHKKIATGEEIIPRDENWPKY